jgi:hypothetical protein
MPSFSPAGALGGDCPAAPAKPEPPPETFGTPLSVLVGGFSEPAMETAKPGGPTGQLYNLDQDIAEQTNLYQEEPAQVAALTQLLAQYKSQGRTRPSQ